MFYLTTAPLWLSGLLLVGGTTVIAMVGPLVIRRRMSLDKLRTNNEVAGFKFATVGVLYAVLLGFAVIVVWEKFNDAENKVALEAGAAATIYRLAGGIQGESGPALRSGIAFYLKTAIEKDWPAMERGRGSAETNQALNGLYAAVLRYQPPDSRGTALLSEVLQQLDTLTQARRARVVLAAGIVPGVIWLVLFTGAILTIVFTFFFGTQNLRAQTLMTGALSVLICSGLLVIIAIDHPFAGSVKVAPEALDNVLADFTASEPGAVGSMPDPSDHKALSAP
jgi:hypothetical protein